MTSAKRPRSIELPAFLRRVLPFAKCLLYREAETGPYPPLRSFDNCGALARSTIAGVRRQSYVEKIDRDYDRKRLQ